MSEYTRYVISVVILCGLLGGVTAAYLLPDSNELRNGNVLKVDSIIAKKIIVDSIYIGKELDCNE